jgi:hypothetical protein
MDTSSHIKAIISGSCTYEDSDEIIGELQFCYLTGMLIGNAACMEHWVRSILTARPHLFSLFHESQEPAPFLRSQNSFEASPFSPSFSIYSI